MFIPSSLRQAKRYTRYNLLVRLYPVYTWYKPRQAKLSNGYQIPDDGASHLASQSIRDPGSTHKPIQCSQIETLSCLTRSSFRSRDAIKTARDLLSIMIIIVNYCYQIVGNAFVRHLYILLCVSNQNWTILLCAEVVIIILIIMIHFSFF